MFTRDPNSASSLPDASEVLNEAQQLAIEAAALRVLVTGSAGTGKSKVIHARVARLLLQGVAPGEIVLLTGSKRDGQHYSPQASDCNVVAPMSLEQYCARLIIQDPAMFNPLGFESITAFEQAQLLKELIDQFPQGHPLKRNRGDVYHFLKPLKDFFSLIKRMGGNIENVNQLKTETLNELQRLSPAQDEATNSAEPASLPGNNSAEEWLTQLESFKNEYDNYQALLGKYKRFDANDLVLQVSNILKADAALLNHWQGALPHVFVDGLEQVNAAEIQLLQLLISSDGSQTIVSADDSFMVPGGALSGFLREFLRTAAHVKLTPSYRPFTAIFTKLLAAEKRQSEVIPVGQVIGLSEEVIAAAKTRLDIKACQSSQEEKEGIISGIQRLLEKGIRPENIVVIFSDLKIARQFERLARSRKIECTPGLHIDILESPIIKKLVRLLRYVSKELLFPFSGDEELLELLHDEIFEIPLPELYRLTLQASNRKRTEFQNSLRKNLAEQTNRPPRDLFDPALHPALANASKFLERLISTAKEASLQQLFQMLRKEPIVHAYLQNHPTDKPDSKVEAMAGIIGEATVRDPGIDLRGFMEVIDLVGKQQLPVTSPMTGAISGVSLLTSDQAAGLAFEHVLVAGLTASSWDENSQGPLLDFTEELDIKKLLGFERSPIQNLYTTLTRSNGSLSLSYSVGNNYSQSSSPSFIISRLRDIGFEIQSKIITDEGATTSPKSKKLPTVPILNDALENQALGKFMMSASALNTWLDCPLGFYYRYILRVPSCGNEATEFGSAVHHALEQFFRRMQEERLEKFPGVDFLLTEFSTYMLQQQSKFPPGAFERRLAYGLQVLHNYHDRYLGEWKKIVSLELNITGVMVNAVPLKGKIDKLEFEGRKITVVDYKSGDIMKAMAKLQPPNELEPNGGDYWRQSVFYKILVDNYSRKDWIVSSTEIDFLEPGKSGQFYKHCTVPTAADIETVKQQFTLAWSGIQQGLFRTGCGKEHCRWCSLHSS